MIGTGLLCVFLFLADTADVANGQSCDREIMRRCRQDVLKEIESQSSNTDQQCKRARENFDCLLFQSASCADRQAQESNRDAILRAWRFLSAFCEDQGSWYTLPCFQKDEVKRCEALMPSKGYSTDSSSCRSFGHFRDCVVSAVQAQCSSSDRKLLGTYLMDKGQQRAWNCPRDREDPASAPLAADTRYTSLTDSSYGTCADEYRSSLRECRSTFEEDQKEAQIRNDSDMRNHKTCCALVNYETCVKDILDDRCGDRGRVEARSLASDMRAKIPYYNCDDHGEAECSGSAILLATHHCLLALAVAAAMAMFKRDG